MSRARGDGVRAPGERDRDQGHDHGIASAAAAADPALRRRLVVALVLTAGIVVVQLVGSVVTGSLALLTDTAHAVADSVGLAVAVVAATLMARPTTKMRTWGFARVEVVAALGQAVLLLAVGVYAAIEAVRRLLEPTEVAATELVVFGVVGLAANLAALAVLMGGRAANHNMRAAFLEVLNDALGSVAVIVAAVVVRTTGFDRADAIAGLFIVALIVPRAFRIVRDTGRVLLEYTPRGVDLDDVRTHLVALEHVREVHDLHASEIGTGMPVISAHVVVDDHCFVSGHAPEILQSIRECVREHFPVSFDHATIQLETAAARERSCSGMQHA
ncbi:cation diffusion facilitator family transporter [Georgenia sp. Z1491]|uniref:cation diffusion facilitator family transporter n=1 Tax=Georgenia sp. Z1491 TaxID=3416707 RepID=UPI003CEAC4D8